MERTIFTDEHDMFRAAYRRFVEREVSPHFDEWERAGIVARELFTKAGAGGFLAMSAPAAYGGGGVRDFHTTPSSPRS
jgi:alkylation response protein AidB-like acyl-CoA dehydrogenase